MTMDYLKNITLQFPHEQRLFADQLASVVEPFGQFHHDIFEFQTSKQEFFPKICLNFQSKFPKIAADFSLSSGETITVYIENVTSKNKTSPHIYQPIDLETVRQRFSSLGMKWMGIDHIGFNLPWFAGGIHPNIQKLRDKISSKSLYHSFPTGEAWDFILPGDLPEINHQKGIDYTITRKPKFELVSFEKTSTPLIQFDISVSASYDQFAPQFPEALNDPNFRNIWIYLENPFPLDICLVINENSDGDWSSFFTDSRL